MLLSSNMAAPPTIRFSAKAKPVDRARVVGTSNGARGWGRAKMTSTVATAPTPARQPNQFARGFGGRREQPRLNLRRQVGGGQSGAIVVRAGPAVLPCLNQCCEAGIAFQSCLGLGPFTWNKHALRTFGCKIVIQSVAIVSTHSFSRCRLCRSQVSVVLRGTAWRASRSR